MAQQDLHSSAINNVDHDSNDSFVWTTAYRNAKTVGERIGLLHRGWGYLPIGLYFQEAEGHKNFSLDFFISETDRDRFGMNDHGLEKLAEARREIARKAFDMLVHNFFKDTKGKWDAKPSWLHKAAGSLDEILHFFRVDAAGNFVNFDRDIPEVKRSVTELFLRTLASYAWVETPSDDRGEPAHVAKAFIERRMKFIDVLYALRKLDDLLRYDCRKDTEPVGEAEIVKLTEIVLSGKLREQIHVRMPGSESSYMTPKSIEEAAWGGSQAGRIAILLRERLKVQEKFDELAEAHRMRQEADRRLAEATRR